MSDEKYVGAIAAAKQAALIKAYVDSKMKKDFVVNITFDSTSAPSIIDDANLAVFNASTDKTFAEISSAVAAGRNVYGMCDGLKWPLYLSSSTSFAFRGHIQLANLFGTVGLAIAVCSIWQDGCDVTVSAGELPVPALDGGDNGKVMAINGKKWELKVLPVDDAMSDTSTNPVQNKIVTAELDKKAGKDVATADADGLMSATDKVKLDGVEDGATKTIVDDAMSDTSTNPVQNKVVMEYIDSRGTLPPVSTQNDTMLIQVVDGAYALRTKESIFPVDDALDTESKNAVENGVIARRFEVFQEHTQLANGTRDGLMSASDYTKLRNIESGATKTIVDAALDAASTNPVQNKVVKTALDGKAGTAVATASANGLMSAADKVKLDGVEAGANKTTVDAALDAESENPVQNKAVKAALDGKLDKTGGTLTGNLRVTGALFSGDGLSFGTGENIHFTKAADDAGKLAHGAAGVDDTVPLARLKVASPTEDDDAATKAYVDGRAAGTGAVRYDAAQTLDVAQQFQARKNIGAVGHNSPQFQGYLALAPANETLGSGVGLSPTGSGHNYTLDISDVDEGNPTLLTGVKTPTDADTNAAATVEYVKAKVASSGGGITPTIGTNGNWYISNTDTGKPSRGEKGDKGDKGDTGAKGDPGEKGDTGAQGAKGDKGETGPQGPKGDPGAAGTPGKDGAAGAPGKDGAPGADGVTPHIGDNGHWYLGGTDTGKPSRGATGVKGDTGATGPAGPTGPAGAPGKDGAGMDITGAIVGQIAKITAVDASGVPTAWSPADMPSGGSSDAVLYTAQTLTDAQKKQARENVDALGPDGPVIKDMLTIGANDDSFAIAIQLDRQDNEAGENFASLNFGDNGQTGGFGVVLSGLANFGDAEAAGLEDTAVSYAQLLDYTKPLMLTYNNNQVTGASYADIRRAIERGRQIKLAVANTPDIIASNAKNETDKCVLRFIHTDVGGDAVNITQYTVTAQASGLTVNVKSREIA